MNTVFALKGGRHIVSTVGTTYVLVVKRARVGSWTVCITTHGVWQQAIRSWVHAKALCSYLTTRQERFSYQSYNCRHNAFVVHVLKCYNYHVSHCKIRKSVLNLSWT